MKNSIGNIFFLVPLIAILILLLFGKSEKELGFADNKIFKFSYLSESSPSFCNGGKSLKFQDLPDAKLLSGIGNSHWKISTSSDSAQIYFNQGINALHAFWDLEAFKAFKKGLKFDSISAIMHWGLSKSISQTAGELGALRKQSMVKAVTLSKEANDYEKDFILASNELLANGFKSYKSSMESYLKTYPNQIDAKLFYASSLSTGVRSHSPEGIPTPENIRGQEILNRVLKTNPNSSAANHYLIHALENGPEPQKALKNAERISNLAPSAGHITHMPGHIYYRIGDYDKANLAFYNSMRVDSIYMRKFKMDPINNWNYTHNLDYLVASCAESGRYKEGLKWATLLSNINIDRSRSMTGGSGYILFGAYTSIPRFYMRFEEWKNASKSIDSLIGKIPWVNTMAIKYFNGMKNYTKGMNNIELDNIEKASENLIQLNVINEKLQNERPEIAADWYFRYAAKILLVNAQELNALIEYKKGNASKAILLLKKACIEERNIGYWEPPHYTRPVYETLAKIYTEEGDINKAEESYRLALKLRPRNGHTQFALANSMEILRKSPSDIKTAYVQFLNNWKSSDDFNNRITHAKTYIRNN